jgi:hypothetical protein
MSTHVVLCFELSADGRLTIEDNDTQGNEQGVVGPVRLQHADVRLLGRGNTLRLQSSAESYVREQDGHPVENGKDGNQAH